MYIYIFILRIFILRGTFKILFLTYMMFDLSIVHGGEKKIQDQRHVSTLNQSHWKTELFKLRLGISQMNSDSQWNPVYNAGHRIFCSGNESMRR